MAKSKNPALGMGMDALFIENDGGGMASQKLRITEISPNRDQPRRDFDDAALGALADSIKQHGVLQPILVRPMPGGGYQIVAGERRWRASRLAGLEEMPVYIKELSDNEAASLALVENLQREDLNPIEEAQGYKSLMERTGATQEEVAKAVGRSRSAVANSLRLLGLDSDTLELVKKGEISAGHARALLAVEDPSLRQELVRRIRREGLNVRQIEELAKRPPKKAEAKAPVRRESWYREVELSLRESMGRVCSVKENRSGGGKFTVEFYDRDDLAEIAKALENIRNKKQAGK